MAIIVNGKLSTITIVEIIAVLICLSAFDA